MDPKTQHGRHAWIQRRSTGGMHGSKDSTQGACMDPKTQHRGMYGSTLDTGGMHGSKDSTHEACMDPKTQHGR